MGVPVCSMQLLYRYMADLLLIVRAALPQAEPQCVPCSMSSSHATAYAVSSSSSLNGRVCMTYVYRAL